MSNSLTFVRSPGLSGTRLCFDKSVVAILYDCTECEQLGEEFARTLAQDAGAKFKVNSK